MGLPAYAAGFADISACPYRGIRGQVGCDQHVRSLTDLMPLAEV